MKRLTRYALLLIVLSSILLFDSCKRGADDPFFSIRSRKARVTGDWTFDTFESNVHQFFADGQAIVDFKLNGTNVSIKVDSIQTSHDTSKTTNGIAKEATYRFDKNSKMEYNFNYELTWEDVKIDENTNVTTDKKIITTVINRSTGSWNFMSNVEKHGVYKYKNKERLSLIFETYNVSTTVVTTTRVTDENGVQLSYDYNVTTTSSANKYANGENAQIWVLSELRNNKISMNRDIDEIEVTDNNGTGSSYRENGIETATLKPTK